MKTFALKLTLALLAVVCFSLATLVQPRVAQWGGRAQSGSLLKVFLGEGRRLFANHFFTQADVSFHSGYYPSMFDQARRNTQQSPMVNRNQQVDHDDHDHDAHEKDAEEHGDQHSESAHERAMAFLQEPKDWIERFGRHFIITEHTHLTEGKEREILPWLRLSAELDPQRVETYTVAAYWLRVRLHNKKAAEEFLREGLRNNPGNCEILFELGQVYYDGKYDVARARNVWDLALRKWNEQEAPKKEPNISLLAQITENLAHLEEEEGNFERAISMFELAKKASPHPEDLAKRIEELKVKLVAPGQNK